MIKFSDFMLALIDFTGFTFKWTLFTIGVGMFESWVYDGAANIPHALSVGLAWIVIVLGGFTLVSGIFIVIATLTALVIEAGHS